MRRIHWSLFLCALVFPVLASPQAAQGSGATKVTRTERNYRINLRSVRRRFKDPGREFRWHKRTRAKYERFVKFAIPKINTALKKLRKKYRRTLRLARYKPNHVIAREKAATGNPARSRIVLYDPVAQKTVLKSRGPFNYTFFCASPAAMCTITFAFKKMPKARLRKILAATLSKVTERARKAALGD